MKNNEEKLSMTRELKFKELQEKIDEEESEKLVEEAILKSKKKADKKEPSELEKEIDELLEVETKKVKKKKMPKVDVDQELDELLGKKKKIKKKKEEVKEEKEDVKISKVNVDDDLYLTTSFKPLKKRFKLRKVFKFLFKLIFAVLVLGAFVYFILLPIFKMINDSKPKAIFDSAISYVQEKMDYVLSDLDVINSFSFESSFNVESNMKDYNSLSDINFIFNGGVDTENKLFDVDFYVENSKDKYGYRMIEKDGINYTNYSTSEYYFKDLDDTSDRTYLEIYQSIMKDVDSSDYKYFTKKITDTLKELITEEDLTATREEIEIDGVSNTVVRNSFKLDKKRLEQLTKDMNKILLEDDKFIEIQAKLMDSSVEDVKDSYSEVKEYDKDYTLTFNIYTIKGNKFVGFDIEENGFRNVYYYNIDNKFELHLNVSNSKECRNGGECKDSDRTVLDFIGTKKDNVTNVDLYYNSKDIGSLTFYEFSEEKIEFDYNILFGDVVYEGDVSISLDSKNQKMNIEFSLELGEEYITINLNLGYEVAADIEEFDLSKVLDKDDMKLQTEMAAFNNKLKEDKLDTAYLIYQSVFSVFSNIVSSMF